MGRRTRGHLFNRYQLSVKAAADADCENVTTSSFRLCAASAYAGLGAVSAQYISSEPSDVKANGLCVQVARPAQELIKVTPDAHL